MGAPSSRIGRFGNLITKAALVNALPRELVDDAISIEESRRLFSRFVDQVEIENHDFCNRVCWFCPNSFIDRRSRLRLMPEPVFERILSDLGAIDYAGALTWSRYHEALADASIYERIARARRALPRAQLVVISNGDYMDRDSLPLLESAGVNRLVIDLYLPEGKERDPGARAKGLDQFKRRTGVDLQASDKHGWVIRNTGLKATVEIPCYVPETLSTRGGLVAIPKRETYRRRAVCLAVVRHLVIDFDGKGVLCCQTRSDSREHAGAVVGDLARPGYGLFHLYRDLGAARRDLLAPGAKRGACATCDVRDDGPDRLARRQWLATTLQSIPGAEERAARLWRRAMKRGFISG